MKTGISPYCLDVLQFSRNRLKLKLRSDVFTAIVNSLTDRCSLSG